MSENIFFRFPHTPHLAWLGKDTPRDDKLLTPAEADRLLADEVTVEEKLDGANLGISLNADGQLQAQNRGQYLIRPFTGQFAGLDQWLALHEEGLMTVLTPQLILFGEWCAARHSLDYQSLPDWFLLFDVYDRETGCFQSSTARNALAAQAGLTPVPRLFQGHASMKQLMDILQTRMSQYRSGPLEGIVIRQESMDWCQARAKLVRADFTQSILEHWRQRQIQWNQVQYPGQ